MNLSSMFNVFVIQIIDYRDCKDFMMMRLIKAGFLLKRIDRASCWLKRSLRVLKSFEGEGRAEFKRWWYLNLFIH